MLRNMNNELLLDYIVRGNIVRSRIGWYEKGEKNSKYFLNLENRRSGQATIRKLFDSKGKITVNPKSIMNELKDYYQNLYSKQDSDLNEELSSTFLDNNNIPILSEESMMECEGKLSLEECYEALQMFSNGKAPGNDGFTADFYKGFWDLLGHQLTDALNYSYEHGKPIFNKTLFSKGLIALANILTNTGSLKPWTFFKAKGLNVNDYLLLFGLFNSLPPAWKRLISSNDKISADTLANTSADSHNTNLSYTLHLKDGSLPLDSITSSKLYWKLIEIIQVYPSARHKFSTLFQNSDDLNWEVIYQIPHVVTLDTKTRVFQYKITK